MPRRFEIELTDQEVKILQNKASDEGYDPEAYLVHLVLQDLRRDKWSIADDVDDVRTIVFQGTPKVFGPGPDSVDRASQYATERAAKTKKTHSIICVHKNSVVNAGLAAVYHGVVVHALDKVMDEENER